MPNTRRQIVGPLDDLGPLFIGAVGLHVTASNGNRVTILRAQILAHFVAEVGTLFQRIVATRLWIRQQIEDALGADQVPAASVTADFDTSDGTPTLLEVLS